MHITFVFSSGGGNTMLVVKKVAEILDTHHYTTCIKEAIVTTPEDLRATDCIIFAAPTYDHGVLHAPFERFLDSIMSHDFQNKPCAVIGLGDEKYDKEYTLQSVQILTDFFTTHQGKCIVPPLRIHKSPLPLLESSIRERALHLIDSLSQAT